MKLLLISEPSGLSTLSGQMMRPTVSLPQVDWSREAVLVVDMGEQRTGGYSVAVTDVSRPLAGEVELKLQVRQPGRGDIVAQVITHPYAVARVPREWLAGATVTAKDQHGKELVRQAVSL